MTDLKRVGYYTLGLVMGMGICIWLIPFHKDLQSFCKGDPEIMLTLNGKGLSEGTLYLKCNGELYQSDIEVITHEYSEGNNQVRAYGNFGSSDGEHFGLDTINGGI